MPTQVDISQNIETKSKTKKRPIWLIEINEYILIGFGITGLFLEIFLVVLIGITTDNISLRFNCMVFFIIVITVLCT